MEANIISYSFPICLEKRQFGRSYTAEPAELISLFNKVNYFQGRNEGVAPPPHPAPCKFTLCLLPADTIIFHFYVNNFDFFIAPSLRWSHLVPPLIWAEEINRQLLVVFGNTTEKTREAIPDPAGCESNRFSTF